MEEEEYNEDLDVNVEATVLRALSKLQKRTKGSKKNVSQKTIGVSCRKLVEFLKANFPWMDGDVESQAITALLSCVKTGLVCALDNEKFLLVGTSSKNLISNCVSRVAHGPNCCCLSILKCMSNVSRTCCALKRAQTADGCDTKTPKRNAKGKECKKGKESKRKKECKRENECKKEKPSKKQKACEKRKGCQKKDCEPPRKRRAKRKPRIQKQINNCAQRAHKLIGTSKSAMLFDGDLDDKGNYCLDIHSMPKLKSVCLRCYPVGSGGPTETFSPREECQAKTENKD